MTIGPTNKPAAPRGVGAMLDVDGPYFRVPSTGDTELDGQVRRMLDATRASYAAQDGYGLSPSKDSLLRLQEARAQLQQSISDAGVGLQIANKLDTYQKYLDNAFDAQASLANILGHIERQGPMDAGFALIEGKAPAAQLVQVLQQLTAARSELEVRARTVVEDQDLMIIGSLIAQLADVGAISLGDARADATVTVGSEQAARTRPDASVGGKATASTSGPMAYLIDSKTRG
jgi:hypothetical protein